MNDSNFVKIYDVFISYSSKNEDEAVKIQNILESYPYNLKCWKANVMNIQTSTFFKERIVNAIEHSKIVLFVLSQQSLESNWVDFEINVSILKNKVVFPIIIDQDVLNSNINKEKMELLQFKLGCSQYFVTESVDLDQRLEEIAHYAKNAFDKAIKSTQTYIAKKHEIKFFPYPFVKIISDILLIRVICGLLILLSLWFDKDLISKPVSDIPKSLLMVIEYCSTSTLIMVLLLIPSLIWKISIKITIKPQIMASYPSALYYGYIIEKTHIFFLKTHREKAFKYLEQSADLGYKKAINKIIYMYENGIWGYRDDEIVNQYKQLL